MNCTPKTTKSKAQAAGSPREYSPPVVVTLVSARSQRFSRWQDEWLTPPGWTPTDSLLDQVLYLSIRPGLILRELGDSLVIHSPPSFDRHSLNESAAFLLLHSNGLHTPQETALAYAQEFDLELEHAKSDATRILGKLLDKKLLIPRSKKTYPVE